MHDPRIRVLALIKGLGRGGAELLLRSQARYLDPAEFDFQVAFTLRERDAMRAEFEQLNIPVHSLGSSRGLPAAWLASLHRLLKASAFDVVHVHSPLTAAGARLVPSTLERSRRPYLVYTEHNRWAAYHFATRALNALTYPLDDYRVAVSADVVKSIPVRFRADTEALTHGVDRDHVANAARNRKEMRAEMGIPHDAIMVTTVANLRPEKGYGDLLRAAVNVGRTLPNVIFISVGSGRERERLELLHRRLGLESRFRFLGFRADAVDLLAASDVFCLPSHHEGLPVAIMEATTLGLPVVATAVGGIPEVLKNGVSALLVPAHDPNALAGALISVCSNASLRNKLGSGAFSVSAAFDARRSVERLAAIYRSFANRHRTGFANG